MTGPTPSAAEREAQDLHDHRRETDPDHDQVSCWCCCMHCDFDWDTVTGEQQGARA